MNLFGKEELNKKALPWYDKSDDFDKYYDRIKKTGKPYVVVNGQVW